MNIVSIGQRIRKYRKAKNWSQEVFAEKIGISTTYVGMIERGEKIPALETFVTITNVLDVSPDLLLADVVNAQYQIKSSELIDEINTLPPSERDRIYGIIRACIITVQ